MEFTGAATSYKCIGNEGSKTSFASISQAFSDENYLFPNRQHSSLVLSCEDGGEPKKQVLNRIGKRNLEVSPAPLDHNYCRISSKLHECGDRLAVKKLRRPFRVETPFTSISENLSDQRKTRDGSFCFSTVSTAQLPRYIAWKPDLYSQGTDAMQKIWSNQYLYAFPPFSMINKVLRKIAQDQMTRMLIVAPTWQSQVWYPTLLRMLKEKPLLLPHHTHLTLNQQDQIHPLITKKTLRLAVWTVSGKGCLQQEFQRGLPNLFQVQGDKVNYQITIRPGQSRLVGVVKEKLTHFDVI